MINLVPGSVNSVHLQSDYRLADESSIISLKGCWIKISKTYPQLLAYYLVEEVQQQGNHSDADTL